MLRYNDFCYKAVGVTGFEPATAWSQTRSATGLRYAPNANAKLANNFQSTKQFILARWVSR